VTDFLIDNISVLSDFTLKQMVMEIDECEDYGDDCDKAVWLDFGSVLSEEITAREEKKFTPTYEERINWAKPIEDCKEAVDNLRDAVKQSLATQLKKLDNVNHPSHYTDGKIEVIDYIEDKKLGYHLGNVVKYVSRAGKKDVSKEIEDLKKARWYLDRYIENLEGNNEKRVCN
jgi:hypothetical protein